jgi:hypothetical protein
MHYYRYFVSFVRVPHDETKDIRRWGNCVVALQYPLNTSDHIRALEEDLAEQLGLKSICLMFYQMHEEFVKEAGQPITGNEVVH